jgi:hypothetical protein
MLPTPGSIAWIKPADAVAGDFDGNGTVGPEDYVKWQTDFGKLVAHGGGADGNGDGVVDAADYVPWRIAQIAGSGASRSQSVPEPAAAMVAVMALALASLERRLTHMVRQLA